MGRSLWVAGVALVVVLAGFVLTACSPLNPPVEPPAVGARIEISVEPGADWMHKYTIFWFIKKNNPPQMAFWVEDLQGKYIGTIYVTRVSATGAWTGTDRRPYALPVWGYAHGVEYAPGLYMPTREEPLADAVTGATPRDAFVLTWAVPEGLQPGTYVIRGEVNHSTDFNATYTGKTAGEPSDNGQPSVVWTGNLEVGGAADTIQLAIIGHGSVSGADGTVNPDLAGLTTALDIIDSIVVRFIPE